MALSTADPQVIQEIRRLASDPKLVMVTKTAEYDLLAHQLTKGEICRTIVNWIDSGERIKPTQLHSFPGLQGMPAYEMKPRIGGILFYVKVALIELHSPDEYLLLISTHPDH